MADVHLVVVSVPGGDHAPYYEKQLDGTLKPIVRMFSEYSRQVAAGGDKFMVIYSDDVRNLLDEEMDDFHENTMFLRVEYPLDLWMRDFTSAFLDSQIKFKYRPDYLDHVDAAQNEEDFYSLFSDTLRASYAGGFPNYQKSTLKLDGGNVVDNAWDKAVITMRAVTDNGFTDDAAGAAEFIETIEADLYWLGVEKTVCVISDYGDTTGHSDGRVAFLDRSTILVADYGKEGFEQDKQDLMDAFGQDHRHGSLTVGKLVSSEPVHSGNAIFDSAVGAYINMLVSDHSVYVPQFGSADEDKAALTTIRSHTYKNVFGVNTGELAHMGGNVRCMSWQMYEDDDIAKALTSVAVTKSAFKKSVSRTTVQRNVLINKILKELKNMI